MDSLEEAGDITRSSSSHNRQRASGFHISPDIIRRTYLADVRLQELLLADKIKGGAYSSSVVQARRASLRAERSVLGLDPEADG